MINFTKRNLMVFFRDKSAVFFSLLAVLIVLGLYMLFLGDQLVKDVENTLNGADKLMNSWIMAGILAVVPVSTTLGSFGTIVDDKEKKIYKDFRCSPIKSGSLVGGYILSSFCIGTLMSVFALAVIEIYFAVKGYGLLSLIPFIQIFGVILLSVLVSSSMMYFIVSLFTSKNAFATASTIVGTLIGFVTGIYLPIGDTAEPIQYIIKCFPVSHSASLFRKILMYQPLNESFDGVPDNFLTDFKLDMGVEFNIFDHTVTTFESILYIVFSALVFYAIGILITNRKNKSSY